jgi:hypothetical protein
MEKGEGPSVSTTLAGPETPDMNRESADELGDTIGINGETCISPVPVKRKMGDKPPDSDSDNEDDDKNPSRRSAAVIYNVLVAVLLSIPQSPLIKILNSHNTFHSYTTGDDAVLLYSGGGDDDWELGDLGERIFYSISHE